MEAMVTAHVSVSVILLPVSVNKGTLALPGPHVVPLHVGHSQARQESWVVGYRAGNVCFWFQSVMWSISNPSLIPLTCPLSSPPTAGAAPPTSRKDRAPLSPIPRSAPGVCEERVQIDGCEKMLSPQVLSQCAAVCRFACPLSPRC